MSLCSRRGGLAAVFITLALISPGSAQGVFYTPDQQPAAWNINQQPADWDINLAAGAAVQPTFHGSNRYRVIPIPLVIIRWRDMVSLGADGLNLYWHEGDLRVGGGVSYDGGRQDHATSGILSSGDDRLKGLGDIDAAVGLRGFVSYQAGPVYFDLGLIKYLGSENKGILVNWGASAPWAITKHFIVRPHVGATWGDDNYMQTFLGITPLQVSRSIFPQFNAGASVEDVNGGLTLVYLLSDHWFVGADASATQYLDQAARSPITIANTNASVAAVAGYHF